MSKSKTSNKSEALKEGVLVVISAPSGCGKTSTIDRLLKRHPEWTRSISATTRAPRVGEKDGEDYFFMSTKDFKEMEVGGGFLETAQVFDNSYGTPKAPVMKALDEKRIMLFAIDVQGMKKIKKALDSKLPLLTIFVLPPSVKILRERLEGRKTETPEQIDKRIEMAQDEIKEAGHYEMTVLNQNLEQTVFDIETCIEKYQKKRRVN